jgi:E1A-binding protein p400
LTAFLEYQEDDEATLEADEALITECERREELNALQQESELPLDQLLKNYKMGEGNEMLLFVQLAMFRLFEQ